MVIKKNNLYLFFFIILFLIVRFAVLATSPKPPYEDMLEEKYSGAMAKDLISGRFGIPPYEYHAHENTPGGKMIVNLLVTIPFFFLGPSLLALKIIPILFALGSFIAWYKCLEIYLNRQAAFIFSLLFIFPPPYLTKISLMCWGNHFESSFLTALTALFFFSIVDKEEYGSRISLDKKPRNFFFLGFSIGLGIYFALTYVVTLIPIIIAFLLLEKKTEQKKSLFIALTSFSAGIIPWLGYKVYQYLHFPTFKPIFSIVPYPELITRDLKLIIWKLFYLFSIKGFPRGFDFPKLFFLNLNIFSIIYYLIFIFSFFGICLTQKENFKGLSKRLISFAKEKNHFRFTLEFFFIIYFFAYILILLCTNFFPPKTLSLGVIRLFRFISPLFTAILIIITLGIYNMIKSHLKPISYLGEIFFIILLIIGLYSNFKLINLKNFGSLLIYKGYDYRSSLQMIWYKPFHEVNRRLKIMADADYRVTIGGSPSAYDILGGEIKMMAEDNIPKGIYLLKYFNPSYKFNISKAYIKSLAYNNVEMMEKILPLIKEVPGEYKPSCYESLGLSTSLFFFRQDELSSLKRERILSAVRKYFDGNESEKDYKKFFFRGIGKNVTIVFDKTGKRKNWDSVFERICIFEKLEYKDETECYFGAGEGIGELMGNLLKNELMDFQSIPYFSKKFFYRELNDYFYGLYTNMKQLPKPARREICEGINDFLKKEMGNLSALKYLDFSLCVESLQEQYGNITPAS